MSRDPNSKTAGVIRLARHPMVLAAAKCALTCALGARSQKVRRATNRGKTCCD